MKKTILLGLFLVAGTTLGFAKTTTLKNVNTETSKKIVTLDAKSYKITSVTYNEDATCTVTASGSWGTMSVTAGTCAQAWAVIKYALGLVNIY